MKTERRVESLLPEEKETSRRGEVRLTIAVCSISGVKGDDVELDEGELGAVVVVGVEGEEEVDVESAPLGEVD